MERSGSRHVKTVTCAVDCTKVGGAGEPASNNGWNRYQDALERELHSAHVVWYRRRLAYKYALSC